PNAKTDVWVYTDAACTAGGQPCGCNGFMQPDTGSQTGWIYMNPGVIANKSTIAHEYFHTVQFGISVNALAASPPGKNRVMMREASASWIGALAAGNDGGHPPVYQRNTADAVGASLDFPDSSTETLYGDWPFFEFEREQFTPAVVKDD